jgi:hypothetical protein
MASSIRRSASASPSPLTLLLRQPHQLAQIAHQRSHGRAEARAQPVLGLAQHIVRAEQVAGSEQIGVVAQRPDDAHHAVGMVEERLAGAQPPVDVQRGHQFARRGRVERGSRVTACARVGGAGSAGSGRGCHGWCRE